MSDNRRKEEEVANYLLGHEFSKEEIPIIEELVLDKWFDGYVEHNASKGDEMAQYDIAVRTIKIIEFYLAAKRKERDPLFCTDDITFWMSDILKKFSASRFKTIRRQKAIGAIVECLYQKSDAEKNKIKKETRHALAAWRGTNEKTIHDAHKLFRRTFRINSLDYHMIYMYYGELMKALFEERGIEYFKTREYSHEGYKKKMAFLHEKFAEIKEELDMFNFGDVRSE